jgi:hypothetical protein
MSKQSSLLFWNLFCTFLVFLHIFGIFTYFWYFYIRDYYVNSKLGLFTFRIVKSSFFSFFSKTLLVVQECVKTFEVSSRIFTHLAALLHSAMLQKLGAQTLDPPTPFPICPLGHKKSRSFHSGKVRGTSLTTVATCGLHQKNVKK